MMSEYTMHRIGMLNDEEFDQYPIGYYPEQPSEIGWWFARKLPYVKREITFLLCDEDGRLYEIGYTDVDIAGKLTGRITYWNNNEASDNCNP